MSISSQMNTSPAQVSGKPHDIPPVPDDKTAVAMFTAHRINDISTELSHAEERMAAMREASAAGDDDLRRYNNLHYDNHLKSAMDHAELLKDSMLEHYPAEAAEWTALNQVMDLASLYDVNALGDWPVELAKAVGPAAKAASFAHLLQTIKYDGAHARRHSTAMLADTDDACWTFDADHADKHTHGAHEHAHKLSEHIMDNYPEEAKWLNELIKKEELSVPTISSQVLELSFDPSVHPRDAHGRFTHVGGGGAAHTAPHARAPRTSAAHASARPTRSTPGGMRAPSAAAPLTEADLRKSPFSTAMKTSAHVGVANRAYTDSEVKHALNEIEKIRGEIAVQKHAEPRAKLAIHLGVLAVGAVIAALTAGAVLPLAAVIAIPVLQGIGGELAEFHVVGRERGMLHVAHPIKAVVPGKSVQMSSGGVIEDAVTVIAEALEKDGLDPGLALQTSQAMVAYWQKTDGWRLQPQNITEQATGAASF